MGESWGRRVWELTWPSSFSLKRQRLLRASMESPSSPTQRGRSWRAAGEGGVGAGVT